MPCINGKRDLNFINTFKCKQATNDVVVLTKSYTSLNRLVQGPYVNGKNIIPEPSSDIGAIVDNTVNLKGAYTKTGFCVGQPK